MTTRQPIIPRPASKTVIDSTTTDYYLTPNQVPAMRKYNPRQAPRIQTMPPTNEDVGIYSYLDQENMDDKYIAKTLEAIESGEFTNVPDEIISWYNSITQDDEIWTEDKNEMKQRAFQTANEYIDLDGDLVVPPEDSKEVPVNLKENKRFQKRDKMNFIKGRLNQFLSNNFGGMNKKRQVTKRPKTSSVSEPIDKYCGGVLVKSNSFDNSIASMEYIEYPKRRSSTELFISQLPQATPPAKDDNWFFYLENSKSYKKHDNLSRQHSKSLENLIVPQQPRTPTPVEEDPYLIPLRICKPAPIPPPRISSRIMEPLTRGKGFDAFLTQDYVEPKALVYQPLAKTSTPILDESPKIKPPHQRHLSTGNRPTTEYILPEDDPLTPMTRFITGSSVASIPVLSPEEDYNDPRDFNLHEIRQDPGKKYKSRKLDILKPHIQPKPVIPRPITNNPPKPTLPPKPRAQAPTKPNKPKFLSHYSVPTQAGSSHRHSPTVISGNYRV